jgi:hypothetical protein
LAVPSPHQPLQTIQASVLLQLMPFPDPLEIFLTLHYESHNVGLRTVEASKQKCMSREWCHQMPKRKYEGNNELFSVTQSSLQCLCLFCQHHSCVWNTLDQLEEWGWSCCSEIPSPNAKQCHHHLAGLCTCVSTQQASCPFTQWPALSCLLSLVLHSPSWLVAC